MMRFTRRSWGWYLVLLDREHFKVKLLRFTLAGVLSWQRHKLRSELWLFLAGHGAFKLGEQDAFGVTKGDAVLVRVNENHQYAPWSKTLVMEVQYGDKCDEADIMRN